MKIKSMVMSLACLFSVAAQAGNEGTDWSAKSIDRQFGQNQATVEKSSHFDGASVKASTQTSATTKSDQAATSKNVPTRQGQKAKSLSLRPQVKNDTADFWVYDAIVTLQDDLDYDGYYHHFILDFDVDTHFAHAEVYARLYLGIGDDFREFHTTSVFVIDGQTSDDIFTVESELQTGFYPDDYELLIEVYDAYNDELVAVYDGYDDDDLYLLSLESSDYEEVYIEPDVVIVHANGGSMGWLGLLLLPLAAIKRLTWLAKR